mmetsp:Transcript_46306/g.76979  ORF Transcript_46306/g.76979 Transcript_46306/m.76979 type:complete len:472 (+) Transcript_46306:36-1451(+)
MKSVIRSIKNEINNYDEGERLVREATSNEREPPSTSMLIQLKVMIADSYQFPTVVRMLFKRLQDYNNIRHCEKSLIVIEYLIKNADRKFVRYCQRDKKSISKLQRYRYILSDSDGVPIDYGGNIRKRAKRILELLNEENKLLSSRAKAQGYSMKFQHNAQGKKVAQSASSKPKTKSNYSPNSANKTQQSSSSASGSKPKKTTKKKKPTKKSTQQQQSEPQFASFIDMPPDTQSASTSNAQHPSQQVSEDLLSGNWWQQEQNGGGGDDDEFQWFSAADDHGHQTGAGDDGGQFGFGNDDDFVDDQKDDDLDADSWMTTLTAMDNVLEAKIQKKATNKRNVKGRSMAQMTKVPPAQSQAIPNAFGTDDFFNQNGAGNGNGNGNEAEFDPFGMGNTFTSNGNNFSNNNGPSSITALYSKPKSNANAFGFQGNGTTAFNNDPFAGIGQVSTTAPMPAKYVTRQKQQDPFAQFGMK